MAATKPRISTELPISKQKVSADMSPTSKLRHQQSAPILNVQTRTQNPAAASGHQRNGSAAFNAPVQTSSTGVVMENVRSGSNGQSPVDDIPPLETLPATAVDAEYADLFLSHDERILLLDTLNVASSTPDEDLHPNKISKFFNGTKRKRRTIVVTTAGRLLLLNPDDRKLRAEISLGNPHILVREYPYNKKAGIGAISFELQNKLFTIEDPKGTKKWMSAIEKAREYYRRATALSAANAKAALYAATAAAVVGGGPGTGGTSHGSRPSYMSQPSSSGRISSSANSTFLQKNEARKVVRRGR